jgi:hypothetical protein
MPSREAHERVRRRLGPSHLAYNGYYVMTQRRAIGIRVGVVTRIARRPSRA